MAIPSNPRESGALQHLPEKFLLSKPFMLRHLMDTKLLQQAIRFIKQYDGKGGYNKDESYYLRAIMVAPIVLERTSDSDTLLAALMHNIIDRIHCSSQQMALYFNPVAQRIVDGVARAESRLQNSKKLAVTP